MFFMRGFDDKNVTRLNLFMSLHSFASAPYTNGNTHNALYVLQRTISNKGQWRENSRRNRFAESNPFCVIA
jgi:hypothetical protein